MNATCSVAHFDDSEMGNFSMLFYSGLQSMYQYGQDLMKGSWIDNLPLSHSLLASRGTHLGALFKNRQSSTLLA